MTTSYSKSLLTPSTKSAHQSDLKNPNSESERNRKDSDRTRKKKIIEISSKDLLKFDNFVHTDMSLFSAKVVAAEKHVFAPEAYVVEICVSYIPPFKVLKVCEEFRTFYRALKLRFPNVSWPEFPSAFQIIKKSETRIKAFNEILAHICEAAKSEDGSRRAILSIFYAFFLESGSESEDHSKVKRTNAGGADSRRATATESAFEPSEKSDIVRRKHAQTIISSSAGKGISTGSNREEAKEAKSVANDKKFSFSTDQEEIADESNNVKGNSMPDSGADIMKVASLAQLELKDYTLKRSLSCDDVKDIMDLDKYTKKMGNPFIYQKSLNSFASRLEVADKNTVLNKSKKPQLESAENPRMKRRNSEVIKITENLESAPVEQPKKAVRKKGRTVFQKKEQGTPEKNVTFKEEKKQVAPPVPVKEEKVTPARVMKEDVLVKGKDSKDIGETKGQRRKTESFDEEKKEEETNTEKPIRKKSRDMALVEDQAAAKEIIGFSGLIHAKLSTESTWNKYFARISDCSLHLYQSVLDHFPVHVVPCYHSVVEYVDLPSKEYVEVYHYYDADKMQICIDPESPDQNIDHINSASAKNLRTWYSQIKIATQKVAGLNITEENYQPIGKLQLIISTASNIKGLTKNSTCYVRISHTPYVLQTGKSLMGESMKWKQSFFIPICDTFFPITLELVCAYNNGWVKENLTEEVICTSEIVVSDVLSLRSNSILTMDLPFKYSDQKRKQILKSSNLNDNDLHDPIIHIKIKNLSTIKSYFAPQYSDYVEGVKMDSQKFVKQLFKLSLSRIKRVVSYVIVLIRDFNTIYYFKYPLFSSLCFILFTWLILNLEVSNLLADYLLGLTLLCLYKHPKVEAMILPFLTRIFFKDNHLNPFYKKCQVQTQGDLTFNKNMRTEHWKFKLKDEETIMSQLQMAKKSIIIITIIIMKISGFCEKMKNIILWDDPHRSALFVLLTTVGYCVLSIVPIRMIILFSIWAKFIQGLNHYKYLYPKNREVAIHTLGFILLKYFPEHKKIIMDNMTLPWPATLPINNLQKKLIEQLQERLEICLTNEDLVNVKTSEDLICMLETCYKPLKFKRDALEEASSNMFKPEEPKFQPMSILHFIMNVPSDYYRVIHPKMKIRQRFLS